MMSCCQIELREQVAFVSDNPEVAVASCLVYYIDGSGRVIGKSKSDLKTKVDFQRYVCSNELIGLHHNAVIMKRKEVLEAGGYRPEFWPANDTDLWNRIAERGHLVLVQQEYLMKYRIHGSSVSVSGAKMARSKVRWLKDCLVKRRAGTTELSFEEFKEIEKRVPWWERLNHQRKDSAKVFYKRSVFFFSERQYLTSVVSIAVALLLQPSHVVKKIMGRSLIFSKNSL